MHPVGVYFSPTSRNFDAARFLASYRGVLILLLQKHIEFQVVTPRTLATFHGAQLVLPDVTLLTDAEASQLRDFSTKGGQLIVNGASATACRNQSKSYGLRNRRREVCCGPRKERRSRFETSARRISRGVEAR
jgi:hypothetical protein